MGITTFLFLYSKRVHLHGFSRSEQKYFTPRSFRIIYTHLGAALAARKSAEITYRGFGLGGGLQVEQVMSD